MTLEILRDFEAAIRQLVPNFEVRFKDESKWQKVLGVLAWVFNREYMTRYTTTFYPLVWFPSKAFYEERPSPSLRILAHELVHLLDTKKHPVWMRVSYIFPQVLALLAFIAIIPVAILWGLWGLLPAGIGLALLAPWPAPWRTAWEMRGYGMSLACAVWMSPITVEAVRDNIVKNFVSSNYYFMSWSRARVLKQLDEWIARAKDGSLLQNEPYRQVHDFLVKKALA